MLKGERKMNKFNYESPDISIYEIGNLDIITSSFGDLDIGGDTDDDILDW